MTEIRLLYADDRLRGFQISGHAGAGTQGNDLVCAAVSFLATTCANALESVAGVKPDIRQREAFLHVEVKKEALSAQAASILATFLQGARDLAETYPKHVKLIDESK